MSPSSETAGNATVTNKVFESMKANLPKPPTFKDKSEERAFLKFRLAQAFRIFGRLGYDAGAAGHITVRDPIRSDCFWVNPLGLHFKMIQPDDLLLVDSDGNVLESGSISALNTAAFMIHSAIHAARPDVICAAHSHSLHGRAFSSLGKELAMISQDSCAFFNDHAVYRQFKGVVFDKEEGEAIAKALGSCKAVILQNHGLLTATNSIEATVFFYISLEKSCQTQLLADAAGQTMKIRGEEARVTGGRIGSAYAGWFNGLLEFKLLEHEEHMVFNYAK